MTLEQQNRTALALAILTVAVICFAYDVSIIAFLIYVCGLWEVWVRQLDYPKGPSKDGAFYSPATANWRLSMSPETRERFDILTDIVMLLFWPVTSLLGFLHWLYGVIRGSKTE
jgi:hypothetical protein